MGKHLAKVLGGDLAKVLGEDLAKVLGENLAEVSGENLAKIGGDDLVDLMKVSEDSPELAISSVGLVVQRGETMLSLLHH